MRFLIKPDLMSGIDTVTNRGLGTITPAPSLAFDKVPTRKQENPLFGLTHPCLDCGAFCPIEDDYCPACTEKAIAEFTETPTVPTEDPWAIAAAADRLLDREAINEFFMDALASEDVT
jgi:hypothetical protein